MPDVEGEKLATAVFLAGAGLGDLLGLVDAGEWHSPMRKIALIIKWTVVVDSLLGVRLRRDAADGEALLHLVLHG